MNECYIGKGRHSGVRHSGPYYRSTLPGAGKTTHCCKCLLTVVNVSHHRESESLSKPSNIRNYYSITAKFTYVYVIYRKCLHDALHYGLRHTRRQLFNSQDPRFHLEKMLYTKNIKLPAIRSKVKWPSFCGRNKKKSL